MRTMRSGPGRLAAVAWLALAGSACGGDPPSPPLPPVVDLMRQAPAADETIHAARLAADLRGLSGKDPGAAVPARLRELGCAPGGPNGGWRQPFDRLTRVARPQAPLVLQNGERRITLAPGREFVAAIGTDAAAARAGGTELLFVHSALDPPSQQAAGIPSAAAPEDPAARGAAAAGGPTRQAPRPPPGRTFVTFPPWPAAGQPVETALAAMLRRAGAQGAAAVLVVPRPYAGGELPAPRAAARLAAGSGVPIVVWVTEPAARGLLMGLAGTGLEGFARLEGRRDVLPLPIGRVAQLRVAAVEERDRRHNVVGVLPRRPGEGDGEVVALVAPLPVEAPTAEASAPPPPWGDRRAQVSASAELLSALAALRALSDAPRRDLVVAFLDPGKDGLEGAQRLMADPRFAPDRLASALVVVAGNLGGPTPDVTAVGLQASPLAPLAARAAAPYGRRAVPDPAPWRGTLWRSPAWAFLQAGVPALLIEPGTAAVAAPAPGGAPAAAGTRPAASRVDAAPPPPRREGAMAEGLIADARL